MSSQASPRFTLDGSQVLEARLGQVCAQVLEGVRAIVPGERLEGLMLGGGYGRGEGGVLRTAQGDRPYNDLEFYVMVRGQSVLAERQFRPHLAELGHRLSPAAGLEVEFKVITFAKLRQSAPSMFHYDLLAGHRWLFGDDSLLAGCEHHREASRIPLHEATRLLMNRCSGLLFSAERLQRAQFGPEDADFVGRNLAKAQLALGDAVLVAHGQYTWSCRARRERLGRLGLTEWWRNEVLVHHAAGVEFKLHPIVTTARREALANRHRGLTDLALQVWLWLERRRLGRPFRSPRDYTLAADNLCPETLPWKNLLLNARSFGLRGVASRSALRYPRERLFRALCVLLWNSHGDGAFSDSARKLLRTSSMDFSAMVRVYQSLWERYN